MTGGGADGVWGGARITADAVVVSRFMLVC